MDRILLLAAIGAVIGLLINCVSAQLLTHPKQPRRLFGRTFQGILPAARANLLQRLSAIIAEQIDLKSEISKFIGGPYLQAKVKKAVSEFLDTAIRTRLPIAMPMAAMFLSPQLIESIKEAFASDIDGFIDGTLKEVAGSISEGFDVEKAVQLGAAKFSSSSLLKDLEKSILRKLMIAGLVQGAVMGALIGIAASVL